MDEVHDFLDLVAMTLAYYEGVSAELPPVDESDIENKQVTMVFFRNSYDIDQVDDNLDECARVIRNDKAQRGSAG